MTNEAPLLVPVRFHGIKFYVEDESLRAHVAGPIIPPEHVDPDGPLRPEACGSDSFAYIHPGGEIARFGLVIGHRDDLKREE